METTKFTTSELNAITTRFNAIHIHASECSLKERLVSYYMTTDISLMDEEAEKTITSLMSGVEDLTSKYNDALEDGLDPNDNIAAQTAEMSTEQRYDFLVNAISIIKNIDFSVLSNASSIKNNLETAIAELKAENAEITDSTCDELQTILAELIVSSPLMLISDEKIKEMMKAASGQSTDVIDFASAEYDDYRYKSEMALATWIEHKEGNIKSLPKGILPESLGVSIAAGIEEAKIIDEVSSGNKTAEWAVKCLKTLGSVVLVCFLGYIAIVGLMSTLMGFFEASIIVMGSSTLAMYIALAISFLISWGYCKVAKKVVTKTMVWYGDAFDWIVIKFKDDIYPAFESAIQKFSLWASNIFKSRETAQVTLS